MESTVTNADGHTIYYQCKVIDGEPEQEDGTWVRSAAKDMVKLSRMDEYYFASNVDEIASWLRAYGPVIVGMDWYEDMFEPDSKGYVHVGGQLAGGHCWLILGQASNGDFICQNSWGKGWGLGGRFMVMYDDMAELLSEDGEACGAAERVA